MRRLPPYRFPRASALAKPPLEREAAARFEEHVLSVVLVMVGGVGFAMGVYALAWHLPGGHETEATVGGLILALGLCPLFGRRR